jgi:hypothetical protein
LDRASNFCIWSVEDHLALRVKHAEGDQTQFAAGSEEYLALIVLEVLVAARVRTHLCSVELDNISVVYFDRVQVTNRVIVVVAES